MYRTIHVYWQNINIVVCNKHTQNVFSTINQCIMNIHVYMYNISKEDPMKFDQMVNQSIKQLLSSYIKNKNKK